MGGTMTHITFTKRSAASSVWMDNRNNYSSAKYDIRYDGEVIGVIFNNNRGHGWDDHSNWQVILDQYDIETRRAFPAKSYLPNFFGPKEPVVYNALAGEMRGKVLGYVRPHTSDTLALTKAAIVAYYDPSSPDYIN